MASYLARKGQDVDGVYRDKCRVLAKRYGWDVEQIWHLWQQLAACHEYEFVAALPRDAHEAAAWRLIEAIYLKGGDWS